MNNLFTYTRTLRVTFGIVALMLFSSSLSLQSQNRDFSAERLIIDDDAGDGGYNTMTLQVPPGGLAANRTLIFPDSDGSVVTAAGPLAPGQILFGGPAGQSAQSPNLLWNNGAGIFDIGAGNFTVAGATGNTVIGGTLNIGFTPGSVVFAGAGGVLSENNGAFFWDNVNERFGAGTNTPSAKLHGLSLTAGVPAIRGDNVGGGVGVAGISDLYGVQGQTNTGTGVFAVSTGTGTGLLATSTSGSAIDAQGPVVNGVGDLNLADNVDVTGDLDVGAGNFTVAAATGNTNSVGSVTAATFTGTALPAASTSTDLVTSNAGALETRTVASLAGSIAVSTDATLAGDGTTGDPLGIDLTNANTWTGTQTLPVTAAQGDALIASTNAGTTTIDAARIGAGLTDAQVNDNLTINGGTVDATPVGATTPSTGAFTTIAGTALPSGSTSTDLVTSNAGALETRTVASLAGSIAVSTDATLAGDGTTGDPLGIDLTNANTWTATQTLPVTAAQGDALIASTNAGTTTIDAARIGAGLTDAQVNDNLTINGGTVDATPIGATTPSTGAFTTITGTTITGTALPSGSTSTDLVTSNGGALETRTVASLAGSIAVNTDATLTGDGTTGNPLGIDLTNANTWSGAQTFGSAITLATGGGTDLSVSEDGLDRSSGATETLSLDNTGAGNINVLINGATSTTNSRLTVDDGHWTSQQTTAPGAAPVGANVATAVLANETDVAGHIDITTSGAPAAGAQATVTFNTAYATAPIVVLTAANGAGAGIGAYVTRTTAGFTINFIGVPAGTTSYQFFYQVIETQ